jgi:hypothetical protein
MTKDNIDKALSEAADDAEANPDAPITKTTIVTSPSWPAWTPETLQSRWRRVCI